MKYHVSWILIFWFNNIELYYLNLKVRGTKMHNKHSWWSPCAMECFFSVFPGPLFYRHRHHYYYSYARTDAARVVHKNARAHRPPRFCVPTYPTTGPNTRLFILLFPNTNQNLYIIVPARRRPVLYYTRTIHAANTRARTHMSV